MSFDLTLAYPGEFFDHLCTVKVLTSEGFAKYSYKIVLVVV